MGFEYLFNVLTTHKSLRESSTGYRLLSVNSTFYLKIFRILLKVIQYIKIQKGNRMTLYNPLRFTINLSKYNALKGRL